MDQDERSKPWTADATVYEITRFFPVGSIAKKIPALRNIEGVEAWVDLHLRPVLPGKIDMTKEAIVWTQAENSYTVCIEGSHSGLITVSGVALEQLQAGDLLVQERNASQRSARKRKRTTD